jgi:F-type H+-transporting ATPase subunit b
MSAGVFFTIAAVAGSAFASEAAHGHAEVTVPVSTLLFSTINLLIFGYVLNRFAVPPIRQWVRERRNQIVSDLEEAARVRGEAMRLKAEWEERVAKLDEVIRQMLEQAKRDAERERERILADAHKRAEAIHRDAERTIAAELRGMQGELRAQVVREAVQLAEQQVRQKWTAGDQQRFIGDFVKQVGK